MVWRRIRDQRIRGRAYQPRFRRHDVLISWLGGLLAIASLGLISSWSHYPLVVAPFGASTVLLFGYPASPLSQPRNIVLGNTVAAVTSVACVAWLGTSSWSMGMAVGLTIALASNCVACTHPPAPWPCWVFCSKVQPGFVLMPMLAGSLLLTLMAVLFSRLRPGMVAYPHHWC